MAKLRNRLAELIAEHYTRTGHRYTQMEIQARTGIAQSTLSAYINNAVTRYDADTVLRLMQFFRVGPDRFFVVVDDTEFDASAVAAH